MDIKLYKCDICGLIVEVVNDTGATPICCGQEMRELIPGSVDASHEKHVPVIYIDGKKVNVCVGSLPHPMTEAHRIEWIMLKTKRGTQRKMLKADMNPEVCFRLCEGDCVKAVYAYCNLHGLWKAEPK